MIFVPPPASYFRLGGFSWRYGQSDLKGTLLAKRSGDFDY
jgi:hypothetical protein